jgi:hypothetical protein
MSGLPLCCLISFRRKSEWDRPYEMVRMTVPSAAVGGRSGNAPMRNIAPSANQGSALRHRHRHSQDVQRCVAQPMPMSKGYSFPAGQESPPARSVEVDPPLPRRAHHMRARLSVCLLVCLHVCLRRCDRIRLRLDRHGARLSRRREEPHTVLQKYPYGSAPPARSNAPFSLACRQVGPRFVATRCTPWPRGSPAGRGATAITAICSDPN